ETKAIHIGWKTEAIALKQEPRFLIAFSKSHVFDYPCQVRLLYPPGKCAMIRCRGKIAGNSEMQSERLVLLLQCSVCKGNTFDCLKNALVSKAVTEEQDPKDIRIRTSFSLESVRQSISVQ